MLKVQLMPMPRQKLSDHPSCLIQGGLSLGIFFLGMCFSHWPRKKEYFSFPEHLTRSLRGQVASRDAGVDPMQMPCLSALWGLSGTSPGICRASNSSSEALILRLECLYPDPDHSSGKADNPLANTAFKHGCDRHQKKQGVFSKCFQTVKYQPLQVGPSGSTLCDVEHC